MYFIKTPWYLKSVYPSLVWDMPKGNRMYLTFDDGPVPGVTDAILDILRSFQAKATFFCIGDNVRKHPELFQRIIDEGHRVGNHTFHHRNGWKTETAVYVDDVQACDQLVGSVLFRPPYGRIGFQQIQELKKRYAIIMWDVLSGDFDTELTAEDCIEHVKQHASDGSIVVFHDSEKASARVIPALPAVLQHFASSGFQFDPLPDDPLQMPKGLHLS
jgi:peptidoglycan/xylan/chitin deacetylase (PgdA/CDA1 family)